MIFLFFLFFDFFKSKYLSPPPFVYGSVAFTINHVSVSVSPSLSLSLCECDYPWVLKFSSSSLSLSLSRYLSHYSVAFLYSIIWFCNSLSLSLSPENVFWICLTLLYYCSVRMLWNLKDFEFKFLSLSECDYPWVLKFSSSSLSLSLFHYSVAFLYSLIWFCNFLSLLKMCFEFVLLCFIIALFVCCEDLDRNLFCFEVVPPPPA